MNAADKPRRLLDPPGCQVLADTLGDTPETVISVHQLRRGLCRAYLVGNPGDFNGVILQSEEEPEELMGFGTTPEAWWEILQTVQGWTCVEVPRAGAALLGPLIETHRRVSIRYYQDIYHTLEKPAERIAHPLVRQLTIADADIVAAAPAAVRGGGFGSLHTLLTEGLVAGAIVNNHLVAITFTSARSKHYANLAVATLESWRTQGFATATASLVSQLVQRDGQIPVWSAGEDNWISLRIAHRLGFGEVLRRVYIILE